MQTMIEKRGGGAPANKLLKRKLYGFTLAEVLITLGVIGIVAAMTLPALINKAQKMILKNQFKKTYSTLTQVINKSVADLGFVPACNYTIKGDPSSVSGVKGNADLSDCIVLNETFLKNLNIIQKCKGNGYQKGCIPKYKGFEEIQKENNPDLSDDEALEAIQGYNGFSSSNILNRNEIFVLADGNILISHNSSFQSNIFAFDINGKKGPNKWGYDVFSFWLGNTGKSGLILLGGTYSVEKGGKTTRQMIKDLYDDRK